MRRILKKTGKAFFETLSTYLESEKAVILLGAFSYDCAPEDRARNAGVRDQSALCLSDIVAEKALEDVASCVPQVSVQYTHF